MSKKFLFAYSKIDMRLIVFAIPEWLSEDDEVVIDEVEKLFADTCEVATGSKPYIVTMEVTDELYETGGDKFPYSVVFANDGAMPVSIVGDHVEVFMSYYPNRLEVDSLMKFFAAIFDFPVYNYRNKGAYE